ncbi:hypothetical protein C8R44DRAFT_975684 [Mycena epipterygia]|nr:hypothetical protein C8R44DRAFT_975684 [Mycena epipterygia]
MKLRFQRLVSRRSQKFCQPPQAGYISCAELSFVALTSTMMFSVILKSLALPSASNIFGLVSTLLLGLGHTPVFNGCAQVRNSAGSTPSRASGIPSHVIIFQEKPGALTTGLLIFMSIVIALAAGSWVRSPAQHPRQYGRLHRAPLPPPPPPPPPPQGNANANANANQNNADANGGDGDDDPQEDGGADGANGQQNDDLAVAAAPAPEDPPPPGGAEEDGDNDDDDDSGSDGGLSWLALLLLGRLVIDFLNGKPRNATRPADLEHQMDIINDEPDYQFRAELKPESIIAGLLQRQPVRAPRASQRAQVVPRPARLLPLWRQTYLLFAVLPALGLLGAIVCMLFPVDNIRNGVELREDPGQDVPDPELELAPPQDIEPEPEAEPPRQELNEPEPLPPPPPPPPPPNPVVQAAGAKAVLPQRTMAPRVAQEQEAHAPEQEQEGHVHHQDEEREAKEARAARVCEVQRRIWGLLSESAMARVGSEGEEGVAGQQQEQEQEARRARVREVQRRIWGLLSESAGARVAAK